MGETRSMTRNQDHDVSWSDLNHDVLFLVMMRLGVVDFVAFSGVCKSWRSLAPMSLCISTYVSIDKVCHLEDFERRRFKTTLPHLGGRKCVGLTCGYLILFGFKSKDFWLVNPITRHQLHFPDVPFSVNVSRFSGITAILVFSPSLSEWVLVMANKDDYQIWFSIAGKGAWEYVTSTWPIHYFHACKGNIYSLHYSAKTTYYSGKTTYKFYLCEIRLNPHPKLTLLETKNLPQSDCTPVFDSSGGNLYVMYYHPEDWYDFHELDFGEMKWVSREKTIKECALYISSVHILQTCALKPKSWLQFGTKNSWKDRVKSANMWYFPHDCLNVNRINERRLVSTHVSGFIIAYVRRLSKY